MMLISYSEYIIFMPAIKKKKKKTFPDDQRVVLREPMGRPL